MAESLSEGTFKEWQKSTIHSPCSLLFFTLTPTLTSQGLIIIIDVGDYVQADEEIATIETDKVRSTQIGSIPI